MLQLPLSPFLPYRSYKCKLTTSSASQGSSQPWVPHGDSTYLHLSHNGSLSCVATVGTPRYPCETTGTARADWRWGVRGCRCYWGGPPLGVQILYTFPTPKMGIKQIQQFSDIISRILRFLAESSGVTKLELFQPFPHCK